MRWAIIGAAAEDSLEFHLADSLGFLGHEVKIFNLTFPSMHGDTIHYWLRRFSGKYDQQRAKNLANDINDFAPDILIATYRFVHPLTIEHIKKSKPGVITMHINPDALVNLEQQQILASNYDFMFTKDPFMQRFMRDKAGLNAFYLPEAFNPRYHTTVTGDRKELENEENTDVLIFGNMYPYRARIIDQLIQRGHQIKLYGIEGPYFPAKLKSYFANRVINGIEKSKRILGAKIVLNCFHYAEIEGVNCKYFEINGIGGFQLCDFKSSLVDYSPVDPSKYSFDSIDKASELITYYLRHETERHALAEQNRSHFLTHHTYENRINFILKLIGTG